VNLRTPFLLAVGLLLAGPASARPNRPAPPPPPQPPPASTVVTEGVFDVAVGESSVRVDPRRVKRVLLSDPRIAELRLLEEGQYQIRGLALGTTDLWVWYADEPSVPHKFTVVVGAELADLQRRVTEASPGSDLHLYALRDRIVVEGTVPDAQTLEHVVALVRVHDKDFVNLLTVAGDQQVQLNVVFAEVNRTSLRQLGLNALFDGGTGRALAITGPQTSALTASARVAASGASPSLNGGVLGAAATTGFNLASTVTGAATSAVVLTVLEENDVARTLAKPTLAALSGQKATFLGGGRIPIPVQQQNNQVSIDFEEYGVRLEFVPTVLSGDVIDVQAMVEVSELDASNGLKLSGVEIPAVTTRKGQSRLRIKTGSTFALAGMLSERVTSNRAAIPLLGDIPVIGALFRYVRHQRAETELVIFVTPELIRPYAPGQVPAPPGSAIDLDPSDAALYLLGRAGGVGAPPATTPVGPAGLER